MKLAYITATMPTGPGESFLIDEAREIAIRGSEIHIVPRSPEQKVLHEDARELMRYAVLVSPWGYTCIAGALQEILRAPWSCCKVLALVMRTGRFDSTIKNLLSLPKGLWLASYVRRSGIEHIHCHWAATTATIALIGSKLSGIPWSLTLHRGDIKQNNMLPEKIASSQFARFISASGINLARDMDPRICFRNATVIPMGVRVPDAVVYSPNDCPAIVLCPASLIPVKGHRHLIDALAISADRGAVYEIWIAGDGPLRADLESQALALGVANHVSFLGELDHTRLLALYREGKISAVVLPSLDLGEGLHEGIPVSLMEAMAHGVPVISTSTGGIPELVSEGAGILVQPGDSSQLADAIERLISDSEFRIKLGAAGRDVVLERYSVAVTVDGLLDAIRGSKNRIDAE